jgi:hypothetical protein
VVPCQVAHKARDLAGSYLRSRGRRPKIFDSTSLRARSSGVARWRPSPRVWGLTPPRPGKGRSPGPCRRGAALRGEAEGPQSHRGGTGVSGSGGLSARASLTRALLIKHPEAHHLTAPSSRYFSELPTSVKTALTFVPTTWTAAIHRPKRKFDFAGGHPRRQYWPRNTFRFILRVEFESFFVGVSAPALGRLGNRRWFSVQGLN